MTNQRTRRPTRLKPAGWLALIVLVALIVGAAGLLIRPLTTQPVAFSEAITPLPTWTPTPDRRPPTPTPLPEGWARRTNALGEYLAPPPDVEQQIKEAFAAVLACNYAEDAPDDVLKQQPDKTTLCQAAQQVAGAGFTVYQFLRDAREVDAFGPVNPVRCADNAICTVARVKLEVKGVIGYAAGQCQAVGETAPCVYRGPVQDLLPYELFIATVTLEDGKWKVVDLTKQKLPEPLASP